MQRASARIGGKCAGVVELVDAPDSKSGSERSVGSIPTTRTTFNLKVNRRPKSSNLTRLAAFGTRIASLFGSKVGLPLLSGPGSV